jgi:hypothetical protein
MEDISTNGRTLLKLILKRKLPICALDLNFEFCKGGEFFFAQLKEYFLLIHVVIWKLIWNLYNIWRN